jgi:hypothetical protein
MDEDKEIELFRFMRDAGKQPRRGYSDFFNWPIDRELEEWGIVDAFKRSLEKSKAGFFDQVTARGRGNDPPDCEATLFNGRKLGIEVTELVDPEAIMAYKNGDVDQWAEWSREKLINSITKRLKAKDISKNIKGGPYDIYVVIIHTAEPILSFDYIYPILSKYIFKYYSIIDRAFLLMSYDQKYKLCPYIELNISSENC